MRDNDPVSNPGGNTHFSEILDVNLKRRQVLQGGLGAAALGFFGIPGGLVGSAAAAPRGGPAIGFSSVPVSTADAVQVPTGYVADVLYAWGDPVSDGPAFAQDATNTAAEQAQQAGMHHDGMHYFPLKNGKGSGSERGLLVMNHEYTDQGILFPDGMVPWTAEKVAKAKAAHGVSIIEVKRNRDGTVEVVRPSSYGRRITGDTPCRISGAAAGQPAMQTNADPTGTYVLGTLNNCAHGFTPWGTYLACEENWNGYFGTAAAAFAPSNDQRRYGLAAAGFGYRWHEHDSRFDLAANPNEANRFGWVTEIDPFDPSSQPVKRTALGRIKHEGAYVCLAKDKRVVVYSGDDERNEYIYKFVSKERFRTEEGDDDACRAARTGNRSLLDEGTLYVAKFNADGTGQWLPLVFGQGGLTQANGFGSQGEVLIRTRQAADRVGATMMDRPEWIAVNPLNKDVYVTLTNNNRRGTNPPSSNNADGTTTAGTARPPVDASNPRVNNVFGHIVKWTEARSDPASTTFRWDIFVLAGNPVTDAAGNPVSADIFGSPDGLWIDDDGRIWIQTDVSTSTINLGAYAGFGHNQMLCAHPVTKEIRRFLVGPAQCEVTGVITTPDQRTMFVNIQHPGEDGASDFGDPTNPKKFSSWPDGADGQRPRSATVVIRRLDGGVIGA